MTARVITFTLVALSLVNAYSFVRLYSSTYVSSERSAQSSLIANRLPAAIPETVVPIPEVHSKLALDLNCGLGKKMAGLKVQGQWAQLRGRMCGSDKLKQVEITNLNNGFTASVFSLGVQQYQTDLIQLEQGSNKIRVKITPLKGSAIEQTIVIDSHHI